jgi:DNA-binding NtrC family response regulator
LQRAGVALQLRLSASLPPVWAVENQLKRWPFLAIIMLTGHGTLETAITAVKEGAFDYLLKPAAPETLRQPERPQLLLNVRGVGYRLAG